MYTLRLSNLFKPTPRNMRRLGNALIHASQGISIPAILSDEKWIAIVVLLAGWIGKFLSELTAEDNPKTASDFGLEEGGYKYPPETIGRVGPTIPCTSSSTKQTCHGCNDCTCGKKPPISDESNQG